MPREIQTRTLDINDTAVRAQHQSEDAARFPQFRRGQLCGVNEDFGPEQDAAKGAVWRHNGGINVAMADGHVEFRSGREIPVCSYDDPFWSYYAYRY